MEPQFKLSIGSYSVSEFHSGEIQVKVEIYRLTNNELMIQGSVLSSAHLMELLQLVEALKYYHRGIKLYLHMPYCAYSRQDRRCNEGESFSLKIFADLINSCNFVKVTTCDNHSDVSTALINNCVNVPVSESSYLENSVNFYDFYISPDAGANKKVLECSKLIQVPMIHADKQRDTLSGKITGTRIFTDAETLDSKTVLIIDDIMAGGRTFIELAKAIKAIQPNCTIHLYITHFFADYGIMELMNAGITKFIITDSVLKPHILSSIRSLEKAMEMNLLTIITKENE